MSIKVKLATFTKRENSTAQYAGTWTEFDCYLKDDCSVMFPRIELQTGSNLHNFNYAEIPTFNRYYFITDITYSCEHVVITMKCDVLATYKNEIGSSNEYILRSASNYDGDITDTLYPTKGIIHRYANLSTGTPFTNTDIAYVIGCINNETTNKYGAVQYYSMTASELGSLMQYLLGQNLDTSQDLETLIVGLSVEIQNGIAKALSNPTQYIVDSFAIPYASHLSLGSSTSVKTGYWITPATGQPLLSNFSQLIDSGTIDLGEHPQASARGDYLNGAPYTKHWLLLGPFGVYQLDPNMFLKVHQVEYRVRGDQFGNVSCVLSAQGAQFDVLFANVKCPFPVAQVSIDAMGMLQSAVSAASAVEQYYAGMGSQENTVNGIISFAETMLPKVSRSGSQGSMVGIFGHFVSVTECVEVVDDDPTHRGRPYCQNVSISSLSGYILVSDPDVAISGTKEENQQIKSYMSNGFYYE